MIPSAWIQSMLDAICNGQLGYGYCLRHEIGYTFKELVSANIFLQ